MRRTNLSHSSPSTSSTRQARARQDTLSSTTLPADTSKKPPYFAIMLHLGSSDHLSHISKTKPSLSKRAFSVTTPKIWYKLPITETKSTFCKQTVLFFTMACLPHGYLSTSWILVYLMDTRLLWEAFNHAAITI